MSISLSLREFQSIIDATYGTRDRARGRDATFRWLVEEVGELARAIRDNDPAALRDEVADVLAWTVSVASMCGVDVASAADRYSPGCPKCHSRPCRCVDPAAQPLR